MLYHILRSIGWFLCKALFRLKVKGADNVPREEGVIIASNHSSYIDPVVLGVAVPNHVRWIVRKDVYDVWWLKWLFDATDMIRENGSVGKAIVALKEGKTVGVFPEGTRSPDGKLGEGRKGIAVMALQSGAAVVPCAISGAFEAYPRSAVLPRPHPVKVTIGKPIRFDRKDPAGEAEVNAALKMIMSGLSSLMTEA